MKKPSLKGVLVVAVSLLALLLVMELVLRQTEPPAAPLSFPTADAPFFKPARVGVRAMMVNAFESEMDPKGIPLGGREFGDIDPAWLERVNSHLRFAERKEPGRVRIFVLGSSPVWGFVGNDENDCTLFAVYLQDAVAARFPDVDVEVINAAHRGLVGQHILASFNEVLDYDPDLIVVYFGGVIPELRTETAREDITKPRSVLRTYRLLNRIRLFRSLRRWLGGVPAVALAAPPDATQPPAQHGSSGALPSFGVGRPRLEQPLIFDPRTVNMVTNFQQDVHRIFERMFVELGEAAAARQVPVVLFSAATNYADFPPFWSIHFEHLDEGARRRFADLLTQGRAAMAGEDWPTARGALERAVTIGPTFAMAHFELGRVYRALGEHAKAREHFALAKELDASHERSLEDPNRMLFEVGKRYGLTTVDTEALLRQLPGADGYLGNIAMPDHQHLNPGALVLMAQHLCTLLPSLLPEFAEPSSR